MTRTNTDLSGLLQKHDQGNLRRSIAKAVLQLMMEGDVDGQNCAGRHERAAQRTTWRNGYRDRPLDTPAGNAEPESAEAAARQLFPWLPRGPQDLGTGAGCRNPG